MKVAGIIIVVSILFAYTALAQVEEWIVNPETGHWYGLTQQVWRGVTYGDSCSENGDTWNDAKVYAESLGGYLVSVNLESENQWIVEVFVERGRFHEKFWLGLSDWDVEGEWVWASGEPVTYTNWQGEGPNDAYAGEDCAAIYGDNYFQGEWNDLGCTTEEYIMPALIELENEPVPVLGVNWGLVKASY